jgi:aminoglycoside phosphotransferase (APT) family kinase protein
VTERLLPDQAEPVRSGEEIDEAALGRYLATALGRGDPAVSQFRQGHSNLTYLIRLGDQEYVLRRPPFGNVVKTAHDMSREFRILSALAPVFPAAPRPLLYCDDPAIIGGSFYLMERRTGIVIRRDLPPGLTLTPALADQLCRSLVGTLAALHAIDYRAIGLEGFGKPEGYVGRQIKGWHERYRGAETERVPEMDAVAEWLVDGEAAGQRGQRGGTGQAAIVHNDFKFDNVMLAMDDPGKIVAVLDWEMATVGDPLMDLGTMLSYWIEADDPPAFRDLSRGPTMAPGMWTRARLIEEYAQRTGTAVPRPEFYYVFGLFKLAVIVQQIYARYARGVTRDERFAGLNAQVAILARQGLTVIERQG